MVGIYIYTYHLIYSLILFNIMIINTTKDQVSTIGDIKEFKTSIDPKNIEFITTILSSNLYSQPEKSFIREIVSNAWDSHVEAGTTDTPVLIKFDRLNQSIIIRDHGTGLSPERFENIFCNIGSSTKRESNDYHGGFGLGRFSALACTNTVHITSYYQGQAYYYIMIKNGNSITTNHLMTTPSEEKNGVEITIKNIKDFRPYSSALYSIIFFPNIYIDSDYDDNKLNNIKVKEFKYFKAANTTIDYKLLLGNVLYPHDITGLNHDAVCFLAALRRSGIVLKFNIGELDVTPNRESIIYTENSIKLIEERAAQAKKELDDMVLKTINKDYDDLYSYLEAIRALTQCYDPIENTQKYYNGYDAQARNFEGLNLTFKGVDLIHKEMFIRELFYFTLPKFKCYVESSGYKTLINNKPYSQNASLSASKIMMLDSPKLTTYLKSFLKVYYAKYTVVGLISKEEFIKDILAKIQLSTPSYRPDKEDMFIIEGAYDCMMAKTIKLDPETDTKFIEFKNNNKETNKKDSKESSPVILYEHFLVGQYGERHLFASLDKAVDWIKSFHKGVILTNAQDERRELLQEIAVIKGYKVITANKNTIKVLEAQNLKCVIDIDWVLNEDPTLSVAKTICTMFKKRPINEIVYSINHTAKSNITAYLNTYLAIYDKYTSKSKLLSHIMNSSIIKLNAHVQYNCERLLNIIEKQTPIYYEIKREFASSVCIHNINTALVLKSKAYPIDWHAYYALKNSIINNILCKK